MTLHLGRPIAAPLERCAELLGVDLGAIRAAAANVDPYLAQRSTRTTSYRSAVGGMPVSNLAFTTARRLPKRAAAVGIWNSGLVMTSSTTPALRSAASRIRLTWLLKFCTAHSRPASSTIPSTLGTLT